MVPPVLIDPVRRDLALLGTELAATLDGLDPVWWVQALSGYALLPGLATRLAGTVTGRIASGAQTADLAFDLAARPFQYGAFAVPEGEALTIQGKAACRSAVFMSSNPTPPNHDSTGRTRDKPGDRPDAPPL